MRKRIVAVLALVALAGCDATPTISADGVGESQDGGVIFGSGNRSGIDSSTTNTTTTSTGENTGATTSDDGRGGVIFGSGN